MPRKAQQYTIRVTEEYVNDPEAVERGLQLWASYIAEHLRKRLAEEARARREGTA